MFQEIEDIKVKVLSEENFVLTKLLIFEKMIIVLRWCEQIDYSVRKTRFFSYKLKCFTTFTSIHLLI